MHLIDWNSLRALHTPYSSNDYSIVKEVKIGRSAAKHPEKDESSTTIPVMGSTLNVKTLGEMVQYYFI